MRSTTLCVPMYFLKQRNYILFIMITEVARLAPEGTADGGQKRVIVTVNEYGQQMVKVRTSIGQKMMN